LICAKQYDNQSAELYLCQAVQQQVLYTLTY